jgi:hypothetical protein
MLVLLGIIYILFRAARLVRQHIGWGATLFFVFALLVMNGRSSSGPTGPAKNLLAKVPEHGHYSNASAGQTIDLGGSNKLYLRAEFDSANNTFTPHGLYAGVSGIMLGYQWDQDLGMLHQQGTQLHYWTVLNHHWLLLGMPVFTSSGVELEGLMTPGRPFAQR